MYFGNKEVIQSSYSDHANDFYSREDMIKTTNDNIRKLQNPKKQESYICINGFKQKTIRD